MTGAQASLYIAIGVVAGLMLPVAICALWFGLAWLCGRTHTLIAEAPADYDLVTDTDISIERQIRAMSDADLEAVLVPFDRSRVSPARAAAAAGRPGFGPPPQPGRFS